MSRALSNEQLRERLTEAQDRERRAREAAARLKRTMVKRDRHVTAQQKFILGSAVLAWADTDTRIIPHLRRFLGGFIRREADWAALDGTPFARDIPAEGEKP
ncbi:hypothetical protein HL658_20970 [Azospirillum sp. RWY-5-1]|uniref:Mobilization protein n=1 Tax=Azospirillum oleiclasticum TaxID=2735135 RepID=A0ABX2TI58_9PROT|nr:hypothetical protein [Azospirillum oleiclasticum]NYZ15026.1 hypothetical protein [Azospirillum oleiclasticum]NYZ22788.1 hypothetical protein [Azospirillum oleiclasticum]